MSRPQQTPTRTKGRKRALDILFEADLLDTDPAESLAGHVSRAQPPVREFTIQLVEGVAAERQTIDNLIRRCLPPDWELERMPRVDRNLVRLAIYEIWWTDTPAEVAVDEAVTLTAQLSTDESPAFVNGLLGKVLQYHRAEREAADAALASDKEPDSSATVV